MGSNKNTTEQEQQEQRIVQEQHEQYLEQEHHIEQEQKMRQEKNGYEHDGEEDMCNFGEDEEFGVAEGSFGEEGFGSRFGDNDVAFRSILSHYPVSVWSLILSCAILSQYGL